MHERRLSTATRIPIHFTIWPNRGANWAANSPGPVSEIFYRRRRTFKRGLKYFPMDERLLVKGGLALAQLGDFAGADTLFDRAFEWSPNLGQVYAFYGSRLQLE